jgi:hypothetical protein
MSALRSIGTSGRNQQDPVPGSLDRRRGGEEGEADSRRTRQEPRLVLPAHLALRAHRSRLEAAEGRAGTRLVEGPQQPATGRLGEGRIAGLLVKPVEEVPVAGCPMAEAGVAGVLFRLGGPLFSRLYTAPSRSTGLEYQSQALNW